MNKLDNSTFLVTGGAGFIGSNIVKHLLKKGAKKVRVLDNLSTGKLNNLKTHPNLEIIIGDIRDLETCFKCLEGIDYVSHQAALGSVPRSIENPTLTNDVNVGGFVNLFFASTQIKSVKRIVYAASSSTYGDNTDLPKQEENIGKAKSPYAVSKLVNELYAENFAKVYGLSSIGLRYFNVFGPGQDANNPYAAVIPLYFKAIINNQPPVINGDPEISRDFTFIDNVVHANILALLSEKIIHHDVFNVACGEQITLGRLVKSINTLEKKNIKPIIGDYRTGDVMHSLASIEKIQQVLGYKPLVYFEEGLRKSSSFYNEL